MTPLEQKLNQLSLSTMSRQLETTLTEAAAKNLSAAATLEWLADMELEARKQRAIDRRFKCSRLQAQPSIDAFHFHHHKSRQQAKPRILRLLDLTFLNQGPKVLPTPGLPIRTRLIDLGSEQVIEHVHGGGERHALIRLTGLPSEDAGEESLAHAGIADQHEIGALFQEGEIEQTQYASLGLHAALVVMEVKSVDAGLRLKARALEAAFDGAAVAHFQFHVGEQFEGR